MNTKIIPPSQYQNGVKDTRTILVSNDLELSQTKEGYKPTVGGTMDMPRSIRFPKELWEKIDSDAERCKRSSVKQMEAVLTMFYEMADVNISHETLNATKQKSNPSPQVPARAVAGAGRRARPTTDTANLEIKEVG